LQTREPPAAKPNGHVAPKSFHFEFRGREPLALSFGAINMSGQLVGAPEFVDETCSLADRLFTRRGERIIVVASNAPLLQLLRSHPDFRESR
jgi:hypothetical protein